MRSIETHAWDSEADWRNAQRTTRDIVGEPAHLIAAIFAMVMETLGTAPASVGFATLCIVGALRVPVLWPIWQRMFAQTWVKLLLVWMLWTAVSLAWSPDLSQGFSRIVVLKYFSWIALLWPLQRYWKWLLGGFLFATLVMQCIQVSGALFGATYKTHTLREGLRHPTMAGMWSAIALMCWLVVAATSGWRTKLLCVPFAILSAFGIMWARQKAPIVALALALPIAIVMLRTTATGWVRRMTAPALIGIGVIMLAWGTAGGDVQARFAAVTSDVQRAVECDSEPLADARLAMWSLALQGWQQSPVIGVGLGGYQQATAGMEVDTTVDQIHGFATCHSTYLMVLTESGIVGLALFGSWIVAFVTRAIACVRDDPIRVVAFAGVIAWLVAGAVDSFNTRGVFLTVGVIMMALSVMPRTRTATAASSDGVE